MLLGVIENQVITIGRNSVGERGVGPVGGIIPIGTGQGSATPVLGVGLGSGATEETERNDP